MTHDFIFLGSKITMDNDCIHDIKRCLLLGRKTMTNLDSILKSRDITLLAHKSPYSQSYVFFSSHVRMWQWSIKKAEHQINDAFESWCWRRLLRVAWTARKSNWSILKEINPVYLLEGLMLKLKFQYFGHLMWKANSLNRPWCLERLKESR